MYVEAFNAPGQHVSRHVDVRTDATYGCSTSARRRAARAEHKGKELGVTYTARHMIGAKRVSSSAQFAGNARDGWSTGSHVAHAPSTRWVC